MTAIGDALNWLAAAALFPLLLLPIARLASARTGFPPIAVWLAIILFTLGAGLLFAWLTPSVRSLPAMGDLAIFGGSVSILAVIVAFCGGAEQTTARLAGAFEHVNRRIGRSVMWLLLAMALIQFGVVLLRYVFGINYIFMQESITYMHGVVFLLAAGYALLTDDHVRVDIFYREAPPKRKALTDLLGAYLLLFPVCLIIIWAASPYVARSWAYFEGSTDTSGIRGVFLLKSLIPAFATLLTLAGFTLASRAVDTLNGKTA